MVLIGICTGLVGVDGLGEAVVEDLGGLGAGIEWADLTGCRELTAILAAMAPAVVLLFPGKYFRSRPPLLLVVAVDIGVARGEETCGEVEVAEAEVEFGGGGEARRFWFCLETRNDLGSIIL